MFNNIDVCICLRNKMACSSLGFIKSTEVSKKHSRLWNWYFKERQTLWTYVAF